MPSQEGGQERLQAPPPSTRNAQKAFFSGHQPLIASTSTLTLGSIATTPSTTGNIAAITF